MLEFGTSKEFLVQRGKQNRPQRFKQMAFSTQGRLYRTWKAEITPRVGNRKSGFHPGGEGTGEVGWSHLGEEGPEGACA